MRIAFFTLKHNLKTGGGSNRGLDLKIREMQRRGHDVSLITMFSELNDLPADLPYRVHAESCERRSFLDLQNRAMEIMRKYESDADIFYIDGISFIWGGGMYRKAGGKTPVVLYLSTYLIPQNLLSIDSPFESNDPKHFVFLFRHYKQMAVQWLWMKLIGLRYLNHVDRIYMISPVTLECYAEFGFPRDKMEVTAEFVDVESFLPEPGVVTNANQTTESHAGFNLLFVGRLQHLKGLDLLLTAMHELVREGSDLRLTIVGDGAQRKNLGDQITDLDLQNRVRMIPWVSDRKELGRLYNECDAFIHPCRIPEPFGHTILEAMGFGKPIITWRRSGSAWVAGDAGILFDEPTVNDIKNAIADCLKRPELLRNAERETEARVRSLDYKISANGLEHSLTSITQPQTP